MIQLTQHGFHRCLVVKSVFFFFQAEDGIRDWSVTGVQTCALPISIEQVVKAARIPAPVLLHPEPTVANAAKDCLHALVRASDDATFQSHEHRSLLPQDRKSVV